MVGIRPSLGLTSRCARRVPLPGPGCLVQVTAALQMELTLQGLHHVSTALLPGVGGDPGGLGQHKGCMQSSHPQGPADCRQLAWIPAAKAGGLCRRGIIPLDVTSDTAGPIARTVADAAQLLSVMAGIDSADNLTSLLQSTAPPANYTQFLQKGLSVLPPGLLATKLLCMLA